MAVIRQSGLPQNPRRRAFNTQGVQRAQPANNRGFSEFKFDSSRPRQPQSPPPEEKGDESFFQKQFNLVKSLGTLGGGLLTRQAQGPETTAWMAIDQPLSERIGIPKIDFGGFEVRTGLGDNTVNPVNTLGTVAQFLVEESTRPSTLGMALGQVGIRNKARSVAARMSARNTALTTRKQNVENQLQRQLNKIDPQGALPETVRMKTWLQQTATQKRRREANVLAIKRGLNTAGQLPVRATAMIFDPLESVKGAGFAGRYASEVGLTTGARIGLEYSLDKTEDWPLHAKVPLVLLGLYTGAGIGGAAVGQGVKRLSGGVKAFNAERKLAYKSLERFNDRLADIPTVPEPPIKPAGEPTFVTGEEQIKMLTGVSSAASSQLKMANRWTSQYIDNHAWDHEQLGSLSATLEADKVMVQLAENKWVAVEFADMPLNASFGNEFAENLFGLDQARRQRASFMVGRIKGYIGARKRGLLETEIDDPELTLKIANLERSKSATGSQAQESQFRGKQGAIHQTQEGIPESEMLDDGFDYAADAGRTEPSLSRDELPDDMYHVSTDLPAIRNAGRIGATTKGLRRAAGDGQGLGGHPTDAVSLTDSKEIAEHMLREFHRVHRVQTATTKEEFYAQMKQIIKEDAKAAFGGSETLSDKSALWEYIVRFMHNTDSFGNKPKTQGSAGSIDLDKTRGLSEEELRAIGNKTRYDGHVDDQISSGRLPDDAPPRQLFGVTPKAKDDQLLDEFLKLIFPEDAMTRSFVKDPTLGPVSDPVIASREKYKLYLKFRDDVGRREAVSDSGWDFEDGAATREWMESSGTNFINPNFENPRGGWTEETLDILKRANPKRYGIEVVKREQIPDARGQRVRRPLIEDLEAEYIRIKQTPVKKLTEGEIQIRNKLPDRWDEVTDKHKELLETQIAPSGRATTELLVDDDVYVRARDPRYRDPSLETKVTRIIDSGDILREIQVSSDIPLGTVKNKVFKPKTTIKLRDVIMDNGQLNPIVKELGLLRMHETGEQAGQYFWSDAAKPWADAIAKIQNQLDALRDAENAYGVATKDVIGEDLASIPEDVTTQMLRRWNNLGADGRNAPVMPYFGDVVERTNGVNHYFPRFVVEGPNAQLSGNINSLRNGEGSIRAANEQVRATGWDPEGREYQRQMFENVESFTSYIDSWDPKTQNRILTGTSDLEYLGDIDEVIALRFKAGFNRINAQWTRNQLFGEMAGMGGQTLNQRMKRVPAFAKVIKLKMEANDQYRDLVDSFQDLPNYLEVRREMLKDSRARLRGMPPEQGARHLDSFDPLGGVERGIAEEMAPEIDRLIDALKQLPRATTGRTGKPIKKYVKNVYDLEATAKRLRALVDNSDRANSTVLDPKNLEELIELNDLAVKQYQSGWNTFDSQLKNKPTIRRKLEAATGRTIDETEREFVNTMDARELVNSTNRFNAVQRQLDVMDGLYTRLGIDSHSVAGSDMRELVDEGMRVGKAKLNAANSELDKVKAIASQPIDAVEVRTPYGKQGNLLTTGRTVPSVSSGEVRASELYPNRFWDAQFMDRWDMLTNPAMRTNEKSPVGKLAGLYTAANNTGRAINAAMDLSAFGINGLYLMGTSPVVAAKSYWRIIESLTVNPNAWNDYLVENEDFIWEMARKGVFWGAESDTGEFMFPNFLEKVFTWDKSGRSVDINGKPYVYGGEKDFYGAGKAFQISNIAFSRTGNIVRTELFKQMYKNENTLLSLIKGQSKTSRQSLTLKDKFAEIGESRMNGIVESINQATGYSQGSKYSELGGPVFFAPRYMMAQLGFLQKAAVGKGTGANKARDMLLRTGATMGLATELINRSQGLTTDWDPVLINDDGSARPNPKFFKAYIGGQTVSLLGPLDSMMRTLAYIALDPVEGMKWAVKSKSAPVPSAVTEIVTGKTFAGEPVDYAGWFDPEYEGLESVKYGATTSAMAILNQAQGRLPFTAGNIVQDIRDDELVLTPSKLIAYSTNAFGMKAHPTNPYTVLDHAAQDMFDMPYNELRPDDKIAVQEANPKAWHDRNEYAVKMAAFEKLDVVRYSTQLNTRRINEQWWNDQNDLMEYLYDGTIDLKGLNRAYSERNSARIAEMAGNTDEVLYGDTSHANEKRLAVDAWYNAYNLADSALGIDFDIVEGLQADIIRESSLEVREYLQYYFQDDHTTHPEAIRWWLKEGDVLRDSGYYDISGNFWPLTNLGSKYSNILGQDIRSLQDFLQAYRVEGNEDLREEMKLDLSWFEGEVDDRREDFRTRYPEVDRAGILYKGWTTPYSQLGEDALEAHNSLIRQRYTPWSGSPYE